MSQVANNTQERPAVLPFGLMSAKLYKPRCVESIVCPLKWKLLVRTPERSQEMWCGFPSWRPSATETGRLCICMMEPSGQRCGSRWGLVIWLQPSHYRMYFCLELRQVCCLVERKAFEMWIQCRGMWTGSPESWFLPFLPRFLPLYPLPPFFLSLNPGFINQTYWCFWVVCHRRIPHLGQWGPLGGGGRL